MPKQKKSQPSSQIQEYLACIAAYEREFKKWETRSDRILKRYRDEDRPSNKSALSRFNILWSNVQTLVPAVFARLPQPNVSRRFRDNDQVGRVAALILERALEFEIQHYEDYRASMTQCVYDRFLPGRGTVWARYEPHFKASGQPDDGSQITEDTDEAPMNEALDYECAPIDYVHWKDFGHNVARTWEEVNKVWRWVYMNEEAVRERFPENEFPKLYKGGKLIIPFDSAPDDKQRRAGAGADGEQVRNQAKICELWDKTIGKAVWFHKAFPEPFDERDDPLGLREFFPCSKPLYATTTNESLIPVPDFSLYQDQANALDILADRIDGLCHMLQLKGVYDASADSSIGRLFTEGQNGTLLPVKNWAQFAEKNGLTGQIDVYDLTPLVQALKTALEAFEQQKQQVYEITGISDIIRGQSEASETATAQQIKGQYASLRLKSLQENVALFATELLRLKAQIICSKFDPKTILAISAAEQLSPEDQQLVPKALSLLIGEQRMMNPEAESPNPLRSFRVDVAADTLVQIDEQQEKQDRMEMLTSFGAYLKNAAEIGAVAPQMVPLLVEVGKFGLTAFKVGKSIEGTFDQALEQLKKAAQQPPQPDPAVEAEKARAQADMQKAQMDVQVAQTKAGIEIQKSQAEMQLDRERMGMEQQQMQQDMALKQQAHVQSLQQQQQAGDMKSQQMAAQHAMKMRQAQMQPKRPQ